MSFNQNLAIVIGGNHHNTLGVIRSLGEKGIAVDAIIVSSSKSFVSKSKYLKSFTFLADYNEVPNALINIYGHLINKPVVFTTCDKAALVIDNHKEELLKYFILQGSNGNSIDNLMNKFSMLKTASQSGFLTPKTWAVSTEDFIKEGKIPKDLVYPCIVKPIVSAIGSKEHIIICNDKDELVSTIGKLNLIYPTIIVQEFIKKDMELGIVGCVLKNKQLIIPGVIKKYREYPLHTGSTSFGLIDTFNESGINYENIESFFIQTGYCGLFDMEFLRKGHSVYFMEVNYRNGGNGYVATGAGVNLPYIWYCNCTASMPKNIISTIDKPRYFMMDTRDFRHVIDGNINILSWIKNFNKHTIDLVFNRKDIKPWIYKFIQAIA